jgi:hypothetical protein
MEYSILYSAFEQEQHLFFVEILPGNNDVSPQYIPPRYKFPLSSANATPAEQTLHNFANSPKQSIAFDSLLSGPITSSRLRRAVADAFKIHLLC